MPLNPPAVFTPNNNTSFTFNSQHNTVLKIEQNGDVDFMGLHFNKQVADALLKGKSLLVSRTDEGWYINDTLIPDSDFDSEIVARVAKAELVSHNNMGIDNIIDMIKNNRP